MLREEEMTGDACLSDGLESPPASRGGVCLSIWVLVYGDVCVTEESAEDDAP